MRIDRKYQHELLNKLAKAHPYRVECSEFTENINSAEQQSLYANLIYLEEHGLIKSGLTHLKVDNEIMFISDPIITAKGLDFLADDGGLSSILGTITIKLHEDDLRALIATKIDNSSLDLKEKSQLLNDIKSLPSESIKHLTMKLIDKGLENLPAATAIIQSAVQGLT